MRLADFRGDTCSESFYYAASAIGRLDFSGNPIMVDADQLVTKRRLCLATSWYIRSVRVTPAPKPGEDATRGGINWRVIAGAGDADDSQDIPNSVQIATLRTATGHVRQYDIHGVPDSWSEWYKTTGQQRLTPNGAVKAYVDYLSSAGKWQLRILRVPAGAAANPRIQTISVTAGVITLQTDPGLGAISAQKIIISGAKGYKVGQFNGTFRIATYDNTTGVLTITTRRSIDPNIFYERNTASLRYVSDSLVDFDTITAWDSHAVPAGTHKTGNVQEGRRGRRSVKR